MIDLGGLDHLDKSKLTKVFGNCVEGAVRNGGVNGYQHIIHFFRREDWGYYYHGSRM